MPFPKDFLWSASTSATQIEGAFDEDGKCLSIWDCIPKGKVKNNEDCKVACDHYHRYKDDVKLMKELGLKAYRFSINMSRIIPFKDKINEKGLEFYSNLVDELIKNNIEPMVTIYHWDLPFWLSEMGGWKYHKIYKYFEIYTKAVVEKLSDRVKYWISFNEPCCFLFNGYMQGAHAPFQKDYLCMARISKNFFYANASVVRTIRKYAKIKPIVGLSFNCGCYVPKNDTEEEIKIAKEKTFNSNAGKIANTWFLDPILAKKKVTCYGVYKSKQKDVEKCYEPLDFIGLNIYGPAGDFSYNKDENLPKDRWRNMLGWTVDGKSLYWMCKYLAERYHMPIFVSENGYPDDDKVVDHKIHDEQRIKYINEYLAYLEKAINEGVKVTGYSYWSLMDNFEWAEGYKPRFGLIYIDYKTQERIFKDSAYRYKEIIENNGLKTEGKEENK